MDPGAFDDTALLKRFDRLMFYAFDLLWLNGVGGGVE
jgi:hypothetical protein